MLTHLRIGFFGFMRYLEQHVHYVAARLYKRDPVKLNPIQPQAPQSITKKFSAANMVDQVLFLTSKTRVGSKRCRRNMQS
jgi:hypothetical protein